MRKGGGGGGGGAPREISAKDAAWPDFDPEGFHGVEALRGLLG